MKVKELMTPEPLILTPENTLNDAAQLFIIHRIDGAPIVDEKGKIVNIITKTDLMRAFAGGLSPNTHIAEIPPKKVRVINQNAHIKEAWDIKVGRLPVIDDQGNLVGMLTRTDLSNGLLHKELQEATELRTILNSASNGIIIVDKEGIITRCNPSAIRILGLDKDKVVGLNVKECLPELKLHQVIEIGRSQFTEKVKVGEKIIICDRIPLFKDGEIMGGVALFSDISELQNVIDELKTVQLLSQKLDAVIESSYDGIYITDGQANTLRINKSYERITGMKRGEMLGRNMRDLEREGYISQSATLLVLKNRRTTTIQQEFRTGKKALVTGTPVFGEGGEITMVVTNVRDVTELTKLKEQLEKNKELTQKYYSEIEEMRTQILHSSEIVAEDQKMLETMRIAKRVANVDTTVLLLGETGVGKEEIAKFIHKNSERRKNQFIKINCGAIPENLIESELFGYEKGAFTGANREGKLGLFEVAEGGTLFLDEIGELSLEIQVKLLRALQEREITRVGGIKPIKIDVRILAATNRNLEEMVKAKRFREDLYYRLNVVPLTIPPLRERRQDIFPLIRHFLSEINKKYGWNKSFTSEVLNCLYEYDWPGNVRELKNIVERVAIMSNGDKIVYGDLPKTIACSRTELGFSIGEEIIPLKDAVAKVEEQLLNKAFEKHGNVRGAAKELGIDASTFVRKRRKYADINMLQKCNMLR